MINVATIPALTDNYCYLLWREGSTEALVIDASESKPIASALKSRGLKAALVLSTHHHHDHVGGNLELASTFGCEVWCSTHDFSRVPGAKRALADGERTTFAGVTWETWSIPGHTLGQVAFYFEEAKSLFVGDTLFAMGCGRLFEGTAEQMHRSLGRLTKAPGETLLHVGHEYTVKNGEFAESVEPGNFEIRKRIERAKKLGRVVPSPTIAEELKVNPFLRTNSPEIRHHLGFHEDSADVEVFARLREMRNTF
jgi:hydroxyacylglutathione hydrolase